MSDVVDRIRAHNAGHNPKLLAIKYQKMRNAPFDFFRGTCHLFYEDLKYSSLNDAPAIWICGDLHLQNFGIYRGKDGHTYFDIDDFDEGLLAPVLWDAARFLVSVQLAFPKDKVSDHLTKVYLDAYLKTLAKRQMSSIEMAEAPAGLKDIMQKCEQNSRANLLNDWTSVTKDVRRFRTDLSKLRAVGEADYEQAATLLKNWSVSQPEPNAYTVLDVVSRLSGLGSMGVDRYLILIEGSGSPNGNRLIELKQRLHPTGEDFIQQPPPTWKNDAERVVRLQSELQAVPPAPLVALAQGEKAFTLRELYPEDEKIDLKDFKRDDALEELVEVMGCCTAYAHLRGNGRAEASSAADFIRFFADSAWVKPLLELVDHYHHQVEKDYKTFCESKFGR